LTPPFDRFSHAGTWIPLADGRELAAKNGVLEKLLPIFSYVPGDRSPPPAPKHTTAAPSKPRVPRAPAQRRAPAANTYHPTHDYEAIDVTMHDDPPDNETVASESQFTDGYADMAQYSGSRKRRRGEDRMSQADREHQGWAQDLLDYFMLQEDPYDGPPSPPIPPANVNLDRAIDDRGHAALHWAAAMGDVEVVKDLLRRGASVDVQSKNGKTPLMWSVLFTNCFDKNNMELIAALLIRTVNMQEWSGSTVFHHIAGITSSKKKYECARYYMDCILNRMAEVLDPVYIERILNETDNNGDTAITIAARNGARKCVRSLIGRNAAVDIPNAMGETADQLIVQLNHRRQERNRQLSSSPFQPADASHHTSGGAVQPPNGFPFDSLGSQGSTRGMNGMPNGPAEVFKSEAALAITGGLIPSLLDKARQLAQTLDAEMIEKDAEIAEAERVLAMRKAEQDALRRQRDELRAKELEQTGGGVQTDEQLLAELQGLEQECEGLTEEEQGFAIAQLLKTNEDEAGSSSAQPNDLLEKLAISRQLVDTQRRRRDLVKQIVQNLSVAGVGDKHTQYKRLITGALGVREEDVEGMLPEIVAELEDWKGMEGVGA